MKYVLVFVSAVLVLTEIGASPQGPRQQGGRGLGQGEGQGAPAAGRNGGIAPGNEGDHSQDRGVVEHSVHEEGEEHGQGGEPAKGHDEGPEGGKSVGHEIGQGVGEEEGHGKGAEGKGPEEPTESEGPKGRGGDGKPGAGAGEGNSVREHGGADARRDANSRSGRK